jgi:hypothetical protein
MKFKLILTYLLFLPLLFSANNLKLVLDSGEILIGESDSLVSDSDYRIKSDILGEISIPKDKVKSSTVLASANPKASEKLETKKVSNELLLKQTAEVKDKELENGAEPLLISDLYGKVKSLDAPKSWSGNLRIGMNLSFGDREYTHTYLRGKLKIQEKNSPHLFQLSGEYNYRETEGSNGIQNVSIDRSHLNFTYRWFFSESWFFQNASNYRMDKLKGIESELQNILGYGYRKKFFNSLELLIGSGIGFQDRSIVGLVDESPMIINVFQELNWKPSKQIRLNQTLNIYQNPEKLDIYNYEFILGFNYRFTDLLGFEIRYLMDFDNGITEEVKEDSRFQNALIFYF